MSSSETHETDGSAQEHPLTVPVRIAGQLEQKSAGGHVSQPIVYLDTSEVRPGRLAELKAAMNDLARFVQANEPQLLAYRVYFSDDATRMSVLHINPDSASLERHMKVQDRCCPRSVSSSGCSPSMCAADRMTGW